MRLTEKRAVDVLAVVRAATADADSMDGFVDDASMQRSLYEGCDWIEWFILKEAKRRRWCTYEPFKSRAVKT